MNMLVTPHDMNEPLCFIRAVVDVERGLNKHIVNVCHLALLICHWLPPCKGFCKRASCDWICL
ncbi:hypothetical protein XBO1_770018 [Xenorhabdus bovienii str. oregonense]|uniref:Uncharacterized protein n=1 Tax=Xenorhabdus bovienii str. oregonense TaxID=1398202 RepID=A0A077PAT1_XENBV|nr:hypothetical protein XBO1_770018 [Xenorhabdus bovienii str. oregonense]